MPSIKEMKELKAAIVWFRKLDPIDKHFYVKEFYPGRLHTSLSGPEIEHIWRTIENKIHSK